MKKVVIVLGFHKSGTSATAGLLKILGVHMGKELRKGDERNPKGYFEDVRFLELNDSILYEAGGSAWKPPLQAEILSSQTKFEPKIRELIKTKQRENELWGWKATTTCLTVELFLEYLENPHFVVVFRNPLGIAPSAVEHTNGEVGFLDAIALTNYYNRMIVKVLKKHPEIPRHFISFEKLIEDPLGQGKLLASSLEIKLSPKQKAEIQKFIIPRAKIRKEKLFRKTVLRLQRILHRLTATKKDEEY